MQAGRDAFGRWPFLVIAWASLGVAAVGAVLPLLPTTPFLLVSAWGAARGSASLHGWLHGHRRFGPLLRAWQAERAIPVAARLMAVAAIGASWLVLWTVVAEPLVAIAAGLVMAGVAVWILRRPDPRRDAPAGVDPGPEPLSDREPS